MIRTLSGLRSRLSNTRHGNEAQDIRDALDSVYPQWGEGSPDDVLWKGSDLADFTEQTVSGNATWTEGVGRVSVVTQNQTAADGAFQLKPVTFTIGDAWVLPFYGLQHEQNGPGTVIGGLAFTNGTATSSSCVIAQFQAANDQDATAGGAYGTFPVGRTGTLTSISAAPWLDTQRSVTRWTPFYFRLTYVAANTFRMETGDMLTWENWGQSDIAFTMTPTHVGLMASLAGANFPAIWTFGPLLKQ